MIIDDVISFCEAVVPEPILSVVRHDDFLLYFTACLGIVMPTCIYFLYQYVHNAYKLREAKRQAERRKKRLAKSAITVFYVSTSVADEPLAFLVASRFHQENPPVIDVSTVKREEFLRYKGTGLFVVCTADKGREPEKAEWFFDWLDEVASRKEIRRKQCRMRFAVMGYGDAKDGPARFNRAAKTLAKKLRAVGAVQLCSVFLADRREQQTLEEQADSWVDFLLPTLEESSTASDSSTSDDASHDSSSLSSS